MQYSCDICGRTLEKSADRYVVKIEVYAAPETDEISEEDLQKDLLADIRALLHKMEHMSAEELQDGVYRLMRFHLCPSCRRLYLKDPLGREPGGRMDGPSGN